MVDVQEMSETEPINSIKRWKPYPAYKDTGISWMDQIPLHWEVEPIKYNSYVKGRIGWQNLRSDEFTNEGPYLITGMHFNDGGIDWDSCFHITEERYAMAPEIQVKEGDVLITKDGSIGKLAFISRLPDKASLNSHLLVLRPLHYRYDQRFLFHLLSSSIFQHYVLETQTGTTFFGITQESVEKFPLLLPPITEQRTIATFLDNQTSKIDLLIAKKQRLIELLQEKHTTLISQTVTKGLDPNVPMKDSGIEWLGKIPEHWEIDKLKYIASLKSGEGITFENINDDQSYPVYGGNGLRGFTNTYTHDGQFVLIGRQGALCGNINYAEGKFFASEHAVVATPIKPIVTTWLGELLRAMNLNQYSVSAAQPGLAVDRIREIFIPEPSYEEQKHIATFIDNENTKISNLVAKIHAAIEKLQEYRITLISAAVIGKIDVSNIPNTKETS
jgi:type I restriction enzyme S subunit